METQIINMEKIFRSPTLETVKMVEVTIKDNSGEFKKTQIWERLPRKIMWPTYLIILDYLEGENKETVVKIVVKVLKQCRKMDKLRVNKFEMHKPLKHIIIKNDNPVMIDFERCSGSLFPKNVTQFCQFLTSKHFKVLLGLDKKKMIGILKEYKKDESEKNFKRIVKFVES